MIPLALTDPGLFSGILVSACRSLHALHGSGVPGSNYVVLALHYKTACIASLNMALSEEAENPRDATIAKAIVLAGDEVRFCPSS
jgi:hypothetical protein